MFQFLLLTRTKQSSQQPSATTAVDDVTAYEEKPPMVRSVSSSSSLDSWPVDIDDWHDEKENWSFKDDYVSFPSLDPPALDDHHPTITTITSQS
ncbi:predicted protein [Lichtheimia corymbifera JMRC:FSU:9682]|uniref:Uncharacterized protein n=1 Tax=Lichtheimia corymbifera JMRC:FSU:9682 TaxID=1263082 RepID=A0A068S3B6_9FUNG|nr:predicted protein [Lichtheimia corymbifera JMRC:FSU:9682]